MTRIRKRRLGRSVGESGVVVGTSGSERMTLRENALHGIVRGSEMMTQLPLTG